MSPVRETRGCNGDDEFRFGRGSVWGLRDDSFDMKKSTENSSEDVDGEVKQLLASGIRLPAQPRIVLDVLAMCEARQFDLRAMAHLISQDAGLTAMLYKITRSVAFSRPRPPQSVEQVLTLVGIRQTALLVQSYGVTTALKGTSPALEEFWKRSGDIAQLSSLICHERVTSGAISLISPEQAYMAGIFHDCGVPILMQRFPDYCKAVDGAKGNIDVKAEDRNFMVDHCSIGYLLARHWRLPDFVADAIRNHHDLGQIRASSARTMVAILQMALHLYAEEYGLDKAGWEDNSSLILEELGIHPDDLNEFSDVIGDSFAGLQTV